MLPEKEARAIISQVFHALVHLNQPRHRIIHYDLKPANILFDSLGLAKVTDFGLSKVCRSHDPEPSLFMVVAGVLLLLPLPQWLYSLT